MAGNPYDVYGLGAFGRGGGPAGPYAYASGPFGMYRYGGPDTAPQQPIMGQQPQPQQAPGMGIPPMPGPGWADPTSISGAVANPFALDNPFGSGGAFTNFFESHPSRAGEANIMDIRRQAPGVQAGGSFQNPYGTMRQFGQGQEFGAPLSGGYGTGPSMPGPSTYGIGRSNR